MVGRMLVVVVRGREGGVAASTTPVMVVNEWNCCYCCDQQSHMITHLTGISAPGYPCIPVTPVETGTVLHGFGKLKPVPVPVSCLSYKGYRLEKMQK